MKLPKWRTCVLCKGDLEIGKRMLWAPFGSIHDGLCSETLKKYHKDYSHSNRGRFRPTWLALKLAREEMGVRM